MTIFVYFYFCPHEYVELSVAECSIVDPYTCVSNISAIDNFVCIPKVNNIKKPTEKVVF